MKVWRGLPIVMLLIVLPIASACTAPESEPGVPVPKEYERKVTINTYDTQVLAVKLTEGEILQSRLTIWAAEGRYPVEPFRPATVIFYVVDYYGETILDAGTVTGVYQFGIRADRTRTYRLFFDDSHGRCLIVVDYNSPTPLEDVSRNFR